MTSVPAAAMPNKLRPTGDWASTWMLVAALTVAAGALFGRRRFLGEAKSH